MNMEELERTFLARELPPTLQECECKEMLDIYLPQGAQHPHLRIRKRGDIYEMTKKQPIEIGDSSRQLETTIPLSKEEFDDLAVIKGRRVQKTRYYYPYEGRRLEIDVFSGNLAGLVLIDVEFASIEEKDAFVIPDFCLADVTQEEFVAGGMLCGKLYQDIEGMLNQFGYIKLSI